MQEVFVFIPKVFNAEGENSTAPISVFAKSQEEAFQKFETHPSLKGKDINSCVLQIFRVGSSDSGWCLVPLKEEFLQRKYATEKSDGVLKAMTKNTILEALASCRGNISHAAKFLGISRRTVHRYLAKWES